MADLISVRLDPASVPGFEAEMARRGVGSSTLARELIAERLRSVREAELRAAAMQLGRYLTETDDGRDLQSGLDAIGHENAERLA